MPYILESMTEQEEILHERFELIQDFADKRRLKVSKINGGKGLSLVVLATRICISTA